MPIVFYCPHCDKKFRTQDHFAGRRIKCSSCAEVVTIPDAVDMSALPPAQPTEEQQTASSSGDVPGERRQKTSGENSTTAPGSSESPKTDWPFDEREAKRRREETAERLGIPVEKTIDLGGGVSLEMMLIPAGEFMMGSPDNEAGRWDTEGPQRRVRITQPFYMGKHEVTQAQYERLIGTNPSWFKGANNPVETVSWNDAQPFITRLNGLNHGTFRLPTEAEWEYACRARTSTRFYSGDRDSDLDHVGWYRSNSGGKTNPVGGKRPNAWGLYDMHGNVWEWVSDWYQDSYRGLETTDPQGPATGTSRVIRGGSWSYYPRYCRSALRHWVTPDDRNDSYGFRVASPAR